MIGPTQQKIVARIILNSDLVMSTDSGIRDYCHRLAGEILHAIGLPIPTFSDFEEARDWMAEQCEDGTMDNIRFAFYDNEDANDEYETKYAAGCCAFFDKDVIVNGKLARIGCNYGH